MSIFETFVLGLEVTGMGMGLVFLTLIIVMACIWLLDKAFPAKEAADEPATEQEAPAPSAAVADQSGEAVAIATAILLERQKQSVTLADASGIDVENDDEILGEVVTVVTMDPGQGTWKGYGRMQALS